MSQNLSGLQRQIRANYRKCLKMITTKPVIHRPNWFRFLAGQFKSQIAIEAAQRRDHQAIEYGLRRVATQIELYSNPAVQKVNPPSNNSLIHLGWIAKGGKQGLGRNQKIH
ncbi:hypothetical protein O181_034059 [Austropuccinia psidii MF-1]|uniref:Uncharacterized protein n=1 Tax=Austropuccinia psidii MF-1 TaxID=1389203 RepID=A0A9Q3D074_9BASI|nr:hypothetical protein [Austropuccinia psidii MF-1]